MAATEQGGRLNLLVFGLGGVRQQVRDKRAADDEHEPCIRQLKSRCVHKCMPDPLRFARPAVELCQCVAKGWMKHLVSAENLQAIAEAASLARRDLARSLDRADRFLHGVPEIGVRAIGQEARRLAQMLPDGSVC